MVNTKFLSLKTLNALNEVNVKPVTKVMIGETLMKIPEDSRQYFLSKEMNYHNAFIAATNLNRKLGYKAFLVRTNDMRQSYMVYHLSKRTLEAAVKAYEDMISV